MKKAITISIFLISTLISNAQTDTTRVEQYCQVVVTPRILSKKVTIDVDFGEKKSFWVDTRLTTDRGELRKFNTVVDALNYMGMAGWVFINAYPVRMGEIDIYHFAFKKLFLKADIQQ